MAASGPDETANCTAYWVAAQSLADGRTLRKNSSKATPPETTGEHPPPGLAGGDDLDDEAYIRAVGLWVTREPHSATDTCVEPQPPPGPPGQVPAPAATFKAPPPGNDDACPDAGPPRKAPPPGAAPVPVPQAKAAPPEPTAPQKKVVPPGSSAAAVPVPQKEAAPPATWKAAPPGINDACPVAGPPRKAPPPGAAAVPVPQAKAPPPEPTAPPKTAPPPGIEAAAVPVSQKEATTCKGPLPGIVGPGPDAGPLSKAPPPGANAATVPGRTRKAPPPVLRSALDLCPSSAAVPALEEETARAVPVGVGSALEPSCAAAADPAATVEQGIARGVAREITGVRLCGTQRGKEIMRGLRALTGFRERIGNWGADAYERLERYHDSEGREWQLDPLLYEWKYVEDEWT